MNLSEIYEALRFGRIQKSPDTHWLIEARDQANWAKLQTHPHLAPTFLQLKAAADEFITQPIKALPFSLFKLFKTTGSRKEYEDVYFEHRARLNTFAILALADDAPKYTEALEDIIWAICDEYTWCLPAHLNDGGSQLHFGYCTFIQENGILQQRQIPHERTIDLFATETAFAIAEILSLLGNRLTPLVVERGRSEIFRRVIEPYTELRPFLWWETSTMNWAAVCAGSIGAAAMYLIDNDQILAPILNRVLQTMDYYLQGFGEDGACTEGLAYWTYGFGFYTYFASLLLERTAGKINLFQNEKVKQIALFPGRCYLSENYVASFSDSSLTENYMPGLIHYLKRIFPEMVIPNRKYQSKWGEDNAQRWAHAIRNLIWYEPQAAEENTGAGTYYFKDAQWFISKALVKEGLYCFAVKGGHNDEPHNHNDLGSFILHVKGDNLLADIGRAEYTRQYFRSERYDFLATSSRGHSVPVIEGRYQKEGSEFVAKIINLGQSPEQDSITIDITKAYDCSNLKSLQRHFSFKKYQPVQLVLKDEFEFEVIASSINERFITFYKPKILEAGLVGIEGENSAVKLRCKSEFHQLQIQSEVFTTHELKRQEVYIIDFIIIPNSLKLKTEIIFEFK